MVDSSGRLPKVEPSASATRIPPSDGPRIAERLPRVEPSASAAKPVVAAIPDDVSALDAAARELAAVAAALGDPSVEHDRVARRELGERLAQTRAALDHALTEAFGAHRCRWVLLGPRPEVEVKSPGQGEPQEAVGGLVQELRAGRGSAALSAAADLAYPHTPTVGNEMLNRSELTSQGSKARRLLLAAMIEHGDADIVDLGFEGYGPETAMYRAFLARTGLHAAGPQSRSMTFGPPADKTLKPAWQALEGEFRRSTDGRVNLNDVYTALMLPPFGMKAAVVPVLVTAGLLAFRDEVAIYEHGTFKPLLSPDLSERMVRNPGHFDVKHFANTAGGRLEAVEALAERLGVTGSVTRGAQPQRERQGARAADAPQQLAGSATRGNRNGHKHGEQVTGAPHQRPWSSATRSNRGSGGGGGSGSGSGRQRVANVLAVVGAMVSRINGLDNFTRSTRHLKAATLAVREALTTAVEPDDLLFTALREALGFDPVHAGAADCGSARDFAEAVGGALDELEGCLDALLDELLKLLLDTGGTGGADGRTALMGEAARLGNEILDPEVRAFVLALANDSAGSDAAWLSAVATVVARKAPAEWSDDDRLRFCRELPQRLAAFHRLVALHAERRADGGGPFDPVRVTVTRSDGSEHIRLVGIDARKRPELEGVLDAVLEDLAPIAGSPQRAEHSLLALLSERLMPERETSASPLHKGAPNAAVTGTVSQSDEADARGADGVAREACHG